MGSPLVAEEDVTEPSAFGPLYTPKQTSPSIAADVRFVPIADLSICSEKVSESREQSGMHS
jgi:hypothetical protein